MERQEMIARLQALREQAERNSGASINDLETPFALALSDVCQALGLTDEERELVLGREATARVAALLDIRVWIVDLMPKDALAPTAPAAAIPA